MTAIDITGLSHDGEGVGRIDGEVIFVPGALPGETVTVAVGERHKGIRRAELIEVLTPNPERTTPPCIHAGTCGGCTLQICSDSLEAALKTQQVRDALSRLGKLDVPVNPILGMENLWRYRNKGVFHVDYSEGRARIGFFEKGSHRIVPAQDCLLFSHNVCALLEWLQEAITDTGAPDIDKIMVRESHATGEMMVVLVTSRRQFRQGRLSEAISKEWPQVVSLWHNVCNRPHQMMGREFHLLAGSETLNEKLGRNSYALSPASFFQVNTVQAEVLYDCGRALLAPAPDARILDLYCGMGTIGMHMAAPETPLTGVDSVASAIRDAKAAAAAAGYRNARFYTAKAGEWLPRQIKNGVTYDAAIIDPPRAGCKPALLDALIAAEIPRILYISCNPATFARDLAHLAPCYHIGTVQPVNMFPHTVHVETVCLMSRVKD